jgi:hypothetical protein
MVRCNMKSCKRIERFIADVDVATDAGRDREVLNDVLQAHRDSRRRRSQISHPRLWRTVVRYKPTKVAAVIALAALIAGVFGLGGRSVAFSQVGRAVNSTLDRLKELIMAIRMGEPAAPAPLPADQSVDTDEAAPAVNVRAVMCAARFFNIPQNDQAVWRSLKDQGIELIQASAAPETYYATLGREQAEQVEHALTVSPRTSPRVIGGGRPGSDDRYRHLRIGLAAYNLQRRRAN